MDLARKSMLGDRLSAPTTNFPFERRRRETAPPWRSTRDTSLVPLTPLWRHPGTRSGSDARRSGQAEQAQGAWDRKRTSRVRGGRCSLRRAKPLRRGLPKGLTQGAYPSPLVSVSGFGICILCLGRVGVPGRYDAREKKEVDTRRHMATPVYASLHIEEKNNGSALENP